MLGNLRKYASALVLAASVIGTPTLCQAIEIEPGEWQSNETSSVDGKASQPEQSTDCVTLEDARDPVKALTSMQNDTGGKCQVFDVAQHDNMVSFVMKCDDPGSASIDMQATFTFENSRHYTGSITSVMRMGPQKMVSNMAVDAKWIGTCKK